MTKTAVIVQARLGSTRLPGKVLLDLAGQTVLEHVLKRCAAIPGVDVVCCATVVGEENDQIARIAETCGAVAFRGSEDDVLDRYYKAAQSLGVDMVMRVTSDCPLIDPYICGEVAKLQVESEADYACNFMPPTYPHGLDCDVFTYQWLERAAREAQSAGDREHVTPFIRNHPAARKVNLTGPGRGIEANRWTIDTEQDLMFLRKLFARLPPDPSSWSYKVPLAIVEQDETLKMINQAHVDNERAAYQSWSGGS